MTEVSEMLKRIRELSEESAVEIIQKNSESLPHQDPAYDAVPPLAIDLSSYFNNASWSNTVVNSGITTSLSDWNTLSPSSVGGLTMSAGSGLNYQSPYTISNTTGGAGTTWTSMPFSNGSGKIELNGDNADITVNGQSLIESIKKIQERLNILTPNPKMEAEWNQLRELGKQYRELEAKLKEQGDMWAKLKAMPPPVID